MSDPRYSIYRTTGTGSAQVLNVPPYLDKSHISVYVTGILNTSWSWVTDSTITITTGSGNSITIVRATSPAERLTDYMSGVTLTEAALDIDSLQAFYMGQEARDIYNDLTQLADTPIEDAQTASLNATIRANEAAASAAAAAADAATSAALVASVNNPTGSSLVGWERSETGAIARTVQDKLREITASVADFGAVGNGTTDDTAAIQAAITAIAATGGTLLFPGAAYKVTASLTWISTTNADLPGILFKGRGRDGTKIKSYIANGPLFQIQGTKTQASGGTGSHFFNGGGFEDMWLDGTNATGTSQAIRVNGWQYATVKRCRIDGFPGDGVTQYIDAGYANGDYSSSTINWEDTVFWNNAGTGVNQTGYIGAWSWQFRKCLFGYNGYGAVITSSGCSFADCSFTGSGFTSTGSVITGGIHIKVGTSTGAVNRIEVTRCEFDFARLVHVSLDYCQTTRISQCRFIFNDRNATSTLTPPTGVSIAPASSGSNVTGLQLDSNQARVDTTGTCTIYNLAQTPSGNQTDIVMTSLQVSDNTSGAATITKYGSNFQASNGNLRWNFSAMETGLMVIPGKPLPFYLGKTTAGQTLSNSAFAAVLFDTQDATCAQVYPAGSTASTTCFYDTTTGLFTAPATGFYSVQGHLNVAAIAATDTVRIQIVTASETVECSTLGSVNSAAIGFYPFATTAVYVVKGATIAVNARTAGTARSLSTTAAYASRLCIRMLAHS